MTFSIFADGHYQFACLLNNLEEAVVGNGVESGLAVSEAGTPDKTVDIALGIAIVDGTEVTKGSSTNLDLTAYIDATNPTKVLVTMNSSGTISATAGSPAAASPPGNTGPETKEPALPSKPSAEIILGEVWLAAGETTIRNADITDRRLKNNDYIVYSKIYHDTYANLPAAGEEGRLGRATDEKLFYYDDGTNWNVLRYGVGGWYGTDARKALLGQGATSDPAWVEVYTLAIEATDVLRNSNDTEQYTTSTSYVKLKETQLNADLVACRIKFQLKEAAGVGTAYGRIYKNGVAIGTEQSTTSSSYQTYSEDFTSFSSGDLIQLYVKVTSASCSGTVNNFRFYYSEYITHIAEQELTTALQTENACAISVTNQDP